MAEVYDLAIIGSGPAGISAALTAKARNLNFVWFGNRNISMKVEKAERIMNYPGLARVSGKDMQRAFLDQINQEDIKITEKIINQIFKMGKTYAVFSNQESFQAKTLLLAMGQSVGNVIPGESELLGRGVSYCATCDGRLYMDKTVAIICESPEYEEEVKFLGELVKKAYVFPTYKSFSVEGENIEVISGSPKEILGENDGFVSSIVYETGSGDGKQKAALDVDGVFCMRDTYSPASLLKELEFEGNHVKVDRAMKTNLEGVFAAGDITGRPYQYAKAVGEGNVALHSIVDYLAEAE